MNNKFKKEDKLGIPALLTLVFFIVFCTSASATILNVPDPYTTIQAGINASSNGDTVRVAEGTYVENIDFSGKNIVVGSWFIDASDPSYISITIIDGNLAGRVIMFVNGETGDAKIIGFTIQKGSTPYTGGGICCLNASSPEISNNIITENFAHNHGGGIYCSDYCNATIIYNTITNNEVDFLGAGISCYTASPIISYNIITGNTTNEWEGGGIDCMDGANPTITYNLISGNTAVLGDGGGIDCYGSSNPIISNNTITGNSSGDQGGGIYCGSSSNPIITNTIFWGDSAPTSPEIYASSSSSPVVTYCDVQGGWTGVGNINCNPYFCDPATGDYSLAENSCCLGVGHEGADIGAFGVGCGPQVPIPTLSEWGMIIMALLLLAIGTVAVIRRREAVTA